MSAAVLTRESLARRVFELLPGEWTIERSIDDDAQGAGSFVGAALFTARADGALDYEERGELLIGAWRGPAWRRWVYALEGNGLSVRYPDGRLLHHFVFTEDGRGNASARHTHICGEDTYEAALTFAANGGLSLRYAVKGPTKSYRTETTFTRA